MDEAGSKLYNAVLEIYNAKCAAIMEYVAGASDEYMRKHYGTLFGFGDGSDWKRCLGIEIACYDEQHVKLRYPIKIVEKVCAYTKAGISPSCPRQGCFYDDSVNAIQGAVDKAFDRLKAARDEHMCEKIDALCNFFRDSHMEYVVVIEDARGNLIAKDDEGNKWKNEKIYDFVLNECLGFEPDEKLQQGFGAISQDLADTLKSHALSYGVFPDQVEKSIDQKIMEAASLKEENSEMKSQPDIQR